MRLAAAVAGLAAVAVYLAVAARRLSYPFTIEWLESNSLVEVHRLLTGRPLYAAPTVGYVPDGYPPLYFALCAAAAAVAGPSYFTLRLVSVVSSVVCFAVLGRLVQRETGSAAAGTAAAGLFAATYFVTGTWFDVARVDSLFLALSVSALYTARWARDRRGAVLAGVLLAAVFLTKQNGLAEGVAVLAALACGPRRRLAGPAALTYAGLLAASTLMLSLTSHGWYLYYVFEQLGEHALNDAVIGQFWTVSVLPVLGVAGCAALLGARRMPAVLPAGCAALVLEGYAALVHSHGTSNDLLPAYLAVCLLAGLAMSSRSGGLAAAAATWLGRSRAAATPWVAAAASGLVLAQLTVLAHGFRPGQVIPGHADRVVGARLVAGVRELGGRVAVPADPGLGLLAGQPPVEDRAAAADVLRATNQVAIGSFTRSAGRAVAARRFSAIITELGGDLAGFPAGLDRFYRRCPQPLLAGVAPAVFRPVAGAPARPMTVWLPDGRGSCAAAVHDLDGSGGDRRPMALPSPSRTSGGTA